MLTPDTEIALLNQAMERVERDIGDIKSDVRQIKVDSEREFISKQEFSGHEYRLSRLEKMVYSAISVIVLGIIGTAVNFFVNPPTQLPPVP